MGLACRRSTHCCLAVAVLLLNGFLYAVKMSSPGGQALVSNVSTNDFAVNVSLLRSMHAPVFDPVNDSILIYSLGKTSTTSIFTSFDKLYGEYGLKFWGPKGPVPEQYSRAAKTDSRHDIPKDFLQKTPANKTIWVITVARSPCTRWWSMFFYCRNPKLYDDVMEYWPDVVAGWMVYLEFQYTIVRDFVQRAIGKSRLNDPMHAVPFPHNMGWIAQEEAEFWPEFADFSGVNLLDHDFRPELGHIFLRSHAKGRQLNILALPWKNLKQWNDILQVYFPGFEMGRKNVRSANPEYAFGCQKVSFPDSSGAHEFAATKFYNTADSHACLA